MKLTLFLLLLIASGSIVGQTSCEDMKIGNFKVIGKNMGNTIVERTNDLQIEYTEKIKTKIEYKVKWIDDCTYKLVFSRILEDPYGFGTNEDMVYIIEIITIDKNNYTQIVVSPDLDFTFESKVERM